MEPFIKATYKLEGDGALAVHVYEELQALHNHIWVHHYPNMLAVAKHLAIGNATHEQQLLTYAENCVTPTYLYFQSKFDNELKPAVEAFKAARYVSPSKVNELKPDASDIDSMRIFPFLDSDCVSALKSKLPSYLAAAEDVCENVDIIQWWKNHADRLPKWSSVFLQIVLMKPSSAAAERVFSLFSSSFTLQQESSLEDYIQLSVMLQYNYHKV